MSVFGDSPECTAFLDGFWATQYASMTRKTSASSSYVGCVLRAFDNIAPPPEDDVLLLLLFVTRVGRNGGAGRKLAILQLAAKEKKSREHELNEIIKSKSRIKSEMYVPFKLFLTPCTAD